MDTKELVQWLSKLIQSNQLVKFYKSAIWRHLRAEALQEQHNECQMCKANGLFEVATVAHHVKYVRSYPELALTKGNLLCVCKECHYQIHHTIKYKKQLNEEKW